MYLQLVALSSVQCGGPRDQLHGIFSSAAVHATVGTYSQLVAVFTVLCRCSCDSLHSIFSSAAVYAIVGTISQPGMLWTPFRTRHLHRIFSALPPDRDDIHRS